MFDVSRHPLLWIRLEARIHAHEPRAARSLLRDHGAGMRLAAEVGRRTCSVPIERRVPAAMRSCRQTQSMLRRLKTLSKRLKTLEPGKRFQTLHREQSDRPPAAKAALFAAAIACFAVGLVFALIPGPAILFFAFGGALLATQSFRVARSLDATELWIRKTLDSIR